MARLAIRRRVSFGGGRLANWPSGLLVELLVDLLLELIAHREDGVEVGPIAFDAFSSADAFELTNGARGALLDVGDNLLGGAACDLRAGLIRVTVYRQT